MVKDVSKQEEKYPVGTRVYYSMEDYETGINHIYSGVITQVSLTDIFIGGIPIKAKFYLLDTNIGMQEGTFFTEDEINTLFEDIPNFRKIIDITNHSKTVDTIQS